MSAEPSKQQADLVTQIQDHFNNLCYMMYNYVGALQVRHLQRALLSVPAVTKTTMLTEFAAHPSVMRRLRACEVRRSSLAWPPPT